LLLGFRLRDREKTILEQLELSKEKDTHIDKITNKLEERERVIMEKDRRIME